MDKAVIDCLKEMRDACAACFRVIARHEECEGPEELETELIAANVKLGFGVRCQNLITKMEAK